MAGAAREVTIEFKGRAAASVQQASDQARRAVGGVGAEADDSAKKTQTGLSKIGAGIAGFAGGIVGNAATAAAGKVKDFVGSSITAASDMQETLSKSQAIFGDQAAAMESWANKAPTTFGLAKSEALDYAAGLGDMARQIGFTGDQSAAFGQDIVKVSADLGSFNNLETGDVLDRISAALRGEYDSLQAVIPNINAARVEQEALALSGKKSAKELTAQEKALAIQAILHKDGARAMGDFEKTSGGFANQQKIVAAQIQTVQERLGQALLPILTQVMGFVTGTAVPALAEFAGWFADQLAPRLAEFAGSLQGVLPILASLGGFLAANAQWLLPLAGIIAAVVGAVRIWTTVQAALNLVMSANPIGLVVIAIGALVAGLIYAYQNSETFRNIVNGVFTAVRNVVTTVISAVIAAVRAVGDWFARTWQSAVELKDRAIAAFITLNGRIVATVRGLASAVVNWFHNLRDRAVQTVSSLATRAVSLVLQLRDNFVRGILTLRDRALSFVSSLVTRAVAFVINLRDRFVAANRRLRDLAIAAFVSLRDRAIGAVVGLVTRVITNVVSLRDRAVNAVRALRDRAVEAVTNLRERIVARVIALRDTAGRVAGQVRDRVLSPFRTLRDKAVELFSKLRDSIGRSFSGLVDKVKGPLRTVFSWLNRNLISPLNTVTSKFGLNIPDLPKLHSGGYVPGTGERPYMLLGSEGVLNPAATEAMGGKRGIDLLNAGGPGEWIKQFGEFISTPAKLLAQMAEQGVKWAVSQVLGAIPNAPTSGVPVADIVPGVLNNLKSKIVDWASGKEAEQTAELGAAATGNIGSGPWVKPVGAGIGNGYLGYPGHYGVDMPVGVGTPVHAVSNAVVSKVASLTGSYGRHIFLRHADGLVTVYAHLSQLMASVGQQVKTGQVIGRSGNTGNSTGPHLHFETRVGGGYPGPNPRSVMAARGVTLDSGGMLQPGLTTVFNGTGAPEPVLTGAQWSDISKAKDQPAISITINGALDPEAVARQVVGYLEQYGIRRNGIQLNRRSR